MMMQEEPPKYEMCTNNQYDAPPESHSVSSVPVQQSVSPAVPTVTIVQAPYIQANVGTRASPVAPTITIVQPPYVQANGCACGKVRWVEVLFIFMKELFGMSIFTYVACIAYSNIFMLSLGFAYAVLQASLEISSAGGLHLNPVITLAAAISGRMKPILALPMILAQFIGCFLGAGFCLGSQREAQFLGGSRYAAHEYWRRIYSVEDNGDLVRYCFGEFLNTAILVSVFLRLFPLKARELPANEKERQETENRKYIHALFVGLTIAALSDVIFQTRYVGIMNPFRAFGPMVVWVTNVLKDSPEVYPYPDPYYNYDDIPEMKESELWRGHWVYWVGPIVGGILAGFVDHLRGHCQRYPTE